MNLVDLLRPREEDKEWLAVELFRRAAELYEQSNMWREAAECWVEAGDSQRAAELYLRQVDHARAGRLLFDEGRYSEALDCYRKCLSSIQQGDMVDRVTAYLGIAACLMLMRVEIEEAREAYHTAWRLIQAGAGHHPLGIGRCWEALGEYGVMVDRNDLIQLGYERALASYGAQHNEERIRAGQVYMMALKDNRLLLADMERRFADWDT